MANPYKAIIQSISVDGTNYYVQVGIFDGTHDSPPIIYGFPVGTPASEIRSFIQTVVDNQPVLVGEINDLVGVRFSGA